MTSLEKLLKQHTISLYKVSMLMNGNQSSTGHWNKKIRGEASIKMAELNYLLKKVGEIKGISLTTDDIDYDVSGVRVR